MNISHARIIYDEVIVRKIYNLCPGCGEDNMPLSFDWLVGKALRICPKCKTDRTPQSCEEE